MYADAFFHDEPLWSRRPGRRLARFLLPASVLVFGVLAVVQMPVIERQAPLAEILVRILADEAEEPEPPAAELPPEPESVASEVVSVPTPAPQAPQADAAERGQTDWYAAIPEAVESVSGEERTYSVNPGMDERRRRAAEQFYPSKAPVKRPIWENVVVDSMGRTLLVDGDCERVLDDPRVGNRDQFLTFGQYIVNCWNYKRQPQELPFVSEIEARRANQARYGRPAAE